MTSSPPIAVPLSSGTVTGDIDDDLIIVNGGTFTNSFTGGNATGSASDLDRLFAFGGTFTGINGGGGPELQTGAGTNAFLFAMGGVMNPVVTQRPAVP